jgi:hypothetical protein
MKRKKQKAPNEDVYDRGNGITHFPSLDMSCISQNTIVYFLSILIPRFSTWYLLFPSESKESISIQVRNNSLHKITCGNSLYIVLLNYPYYFMHLVLCKLCLLSYWWRLLETPKKLIRWDSKCRVLYQQSIFLTRVTRVFISKEECYPLSSSSNPASKVNVLCPQLHRVVVKHNVSCK